MQSEIPEEIMMHAERLYDEGGYKTVPQIIAEAIMAERAALEAALSADEPVKTPFEVASKHIPEGRASLFSRAIRQGLNDYGWKNFGTLPEVLMGYIVEAEQAEAKAHPKQPEPSVAVKAIEAVWKYSLVIESSVRRGDGPDQYAGVTEALRLVKEARSALSAQVQDVAGKPIGYMRKQDNDGNSFLVHRVQNAYYSEPVYVAAPAKQEG